MANEPVYKTKREPLINPKFANPSEWPKADSGKLSIFEAIRIAGSAMFGPNWAGTELGALEWPLAPQRTYDLFLKQLRSPAPINFGGGATGSRARYTDAPKNRLLAALDQPDGHVTAYRIEQTRKLVAEEQRVWEANQQARDRLFNAVEWLAQRCRDGELTSYARPASLGALSTMFPMEWNLENAFERYVSKGTFERYFTEYQQTWSAYIFFDRGELARVIATLSHAAAFVRQTDLERLSPYLRLAVKLAVSKGFTSREGAETQAIREAEVRAVWIDAMPDVPPSQNAITAIAKVMGFPDSAAILQGGSKKRVRP